MPLKTFKILQAWNAHFSSKIFHSAQAYAVFQLFISLPFRCKDYFGCQMLPSIWKTALKTSFFHSNVVFIYYYQNKSLGHRQDIKFTCLTWFNFATCTKRSNEGKANKSSGGDLVGVLQNVDNTDFALLVYSLHPDLYGNQHQHKNMKIYNLHIKNKQIYNA